MSRVTNHVPVRTCAGCGARDAQVAMIRLRMDGAVIVPVAANPVGRSAYVHRREKCIDALAATRLLARSLRHPAGKPERVALANTLLASLASGAMTKDETERTSARK